MRRFCSYFGLLFILNISLVSGQNVNKIIKNVQKTYDRMDNLSATFRQLESFKLTGTKSETEGRIFVKNGTKYRFESEDQVIVTDGDTVWTYNNISKQLLIDRVRKNSGALLPRDLLFKYPKKYYATLLNTEKTDGKTIYLIRLDPQEGSHSYFQNIKLWVEKGNWHIRKIETTDLNGNSTTFQIRNMDTQTKLADDLFIYKPPAGAEVVDMRK